MADGRMDRSMPDKKRQQAIRRKKERIRRFLWMEFTVVVALTSFLAGRHSGARAGTEEERSGEAVNYYSSADAGDSIVSGRLQEGKLQEGKFQEELLLVNKDHKLPDDYDPVLKTLPDGVNKAAEAAYQPLCDMLAAGRKEGLSFEICSSYRTVQRQQELLDEDVKALMNRGYTYDKAYEEVTRETMPPGYSEHATGLAFDIVALAYQMLDKGQEKTAENKWLKKHCAEYGFILRYPSDKEAVTQIDYESWHFRYVGKEAAAYIMERGITLEEYLEELQAVV